MSKQSRSGGRAGGGEVVIKSGSVVNPDGVRKADVRVSGGIVAEVGENLDGPDVIDANGMYVSSGFVDLHTHLREPGREEAETIESGSRAAARGGYTAVVAMPNTDPAQDSVHIVRFVREQGRRAGLVDVHPAGCITVGREGRQLAPYASLAAEGVRIFTDDGNGVQDPLVMRRALEYARDLGIVLAQHCEVSRLTEGAVMHEGSCCTSMGVPGWPSVAEELMLHRDIELVRLTGAPMHFLHLSTAGSVELVRRAKNDGLPVTAEVAPHHLSLTEELLTGRHRGPEGRCRRRHDRRGRHRSRAPSPAHEGTPARPGAAGDARARDCSRGPRHVREPGPRPDRRAPVMEPRADRGHLRSSRASRRGR